MEEEEKNSRSGTSPKAFQPGVKNKFLLRASDFFSVGRIAIFYEPACQVTPNRQRSEIRF
jgi:hypothetical protein